TSSSNSPIVTQPWGDFPTLMRHADHARAGGDLKRADRFYQRAVELNPNSAPAWAGCASTTSNIDEAIVGWGYALALEPKDETRSLLSACVLEKIKQSTSKDAASLVTVGRRLAEAGQWAFAHHLFQCATELEPSNENAWMWRAGVAQAADETVLCLKRVLELNPQNGQAKAGLAWAASKRTATPVSPDAVQQAAVAFEEGQRALREGDRSGAYGQFHRATELDPHNASAWFWRGSTAPDTHAALDDMEQVLAVDPENQAAKDSQWWLRVQSLREHSPVLSNPNPVLATPTPIYQEPVKTRSRFAPLLLLLVLGCLIGGLVLLLWAAWYIGYLR
ncbi:MAG TPA: hypothetical protein VF478_01500, partial [Anaerolineae bacterium]